MWNENTVGRWDWWHRSVGHCSQGAVQNAGAEDPQAASDAPNFPGEATICLDRLFFWSPARKMWLEAYYTQVAGSGYACLRWYCLLIWSGACAVRAVTPSSHDVVAFSHSRLHGRRVDGKEERGSSFFPSRASGQSGKSATTSARTSPAQLSPDRVMGLFSRLIIHTFFNLFF
jgi:hypothetical protein